MNKWVVLIWTIVISTAIAGQPSGFRAIGDEGSFRKKMTEAANGIQTIKSNFVQEKNLSVLSEKIVSKGDFLFKKQNMVRMEYTSPFKYLIIINKDKILIKDEQKTNTFSAKSNKIFEHVNRIIIDCVQGTALDNKDFKVKAYENDSQYLLSLTPVKKDMKEFFSTISIFVEKKDYSVYKMDMSEPSGDNTVITFLNKQLNVNIPDAVFAVK